MARSIVRKQNPIAQRLVEIGRCYKGSPSGTSTRSKLYKGGDDYASSQIRFEPAERFKFHPATSDAFPNLHEELKAAWDGMIKQGSISIRFPSSSVEENFIYSNKVIKAIGNSTKTFRECDGETCTKWVESAPHPTKQGETIPIFKRGAIPCSAKEDGKECPEGCQAKGMLKFMVPDLYPGGIILFPLNSPVDVSAIAGYLEPWRTLDLSAVPFSLFRMKQPVSWEEKGETKTKDNWGVHIAIDPTFSRLMLQGSEQRYREQVAMGDFTPVALSSSKPMALPPSPSTPDKLYPLRTSDDGAVFEQQVKEAIRNGDFRLLSEAVDNAKELVWSGLYTSSSIYWIETEESFAKESIASMGKTASTHQIKPTQSKPQSKPQPKQMTAIAPAPESEGANLISKTDRDALWRTAQQTGYTADGFRGLVEMFGFSASKEITLESYGGIFEAAKDEDLMDEINTAQAIRQVS